MTQQHDGSEPADDPYGEHQAADSAAERVVLGSCMLQPDIIEAVRAIITPEQFDDWRHGIIAAAIWRLADEKAPTDMVAVAHELNSNAATRGKFPATYLAQMVEAVAVAAQAPWYAEIVRERWQRRELVKVGRRFIGLGSETVDGDTAEAIGQAQQWLTELERAVPAAELPSTAADLIPDTLDLIEHPRPEDAGISTGLHDLDEVLGGLRPGQLIYVGARPAVGKSVLLLNIARHAAIRLGIPTLFVSLEMSANEVMLRIISAEARVEHAHLRDSLPTESDWDAIQRILGPLSDSKLFLHETQGISIPQLRRLVHTLKRQHGLGLVVVDYLQLMQAPPGENRQVAVSEMSRQLKIMAGEFQLPVIAATQLNRGPESRSDRRPALADLRESGSLEQDANVVILLHREDAHERESPRAGELDLIVAKNRAGRQATVTVAFQGHYARAMSMAATVSEGESR